MTGVGLDECWRGLCAILGGEPVADSDVAPAAERLRAHGLAPLCYVAGARQFRRDYAAVLFDAEHRTRILGEAVAALAGAGVAVILLKGCSYVGDIYPDAALRPMSDLDLLVEPDRVEDALEVLGSIGYVMPERYRGSVSVHHAIQLGHREHGRSIDLHRDILQPWRSGLDLRATWLRAIPAGDLVGAHRLEPIDQVLWHWAHLGRSQMFNPLIAFVDAHRLYDRLDSRDRRELDRRAAAAGLNRVARASRMITEALTRGRERADLPWWGRALPSSREIISAVMPPRWLQLTRKITLSDHPAQVIGLGASYVVRSQRARRAAREAGALHSNRPSGSRRHRP